MELIRDHPLEYYYKISQANGNKIFYHRNSEGHKRIAKNKIPLDFIDRIKKYDSQKDPDMLRSKKETEKKLEDYVENLRKLESLNLSAKNYERSRRVYEDRIAFSRQHIKQFDDMNKKYSDDRYKTLMDDFFNTIEKQDIEEIQVLIKDPYVDPSVNDNQALQDAVLKGHYEVVKLLLTDPRIDPSANENTCIQDASKKGYYEIVKLLLSDPRVDPSVYNNHPIRLAVTYNHYKVVKILLADPRVDPSSENNEAIHQAVSRNSIELVKLLLSDPRVDPSTRQNQSIKNATQSGFTKVVKLLLSDPRVDPSVVGNYLVQNTANNGHYDVVKLLITDPRVDWRIINSEMLIRLLKDADIELKNYLKTSLLAINRITPKMKIHISQERNSNIQDGNEKYMIPKSIRKYISYRASYEELRIIKGDIPPIKSFVLANILKIQYDQNITWKELRVKIKSSLLQML